MSLKPRTSVSQTSEEDEVQIFARQMLQNRLFLGHYQERRYVDLLKEYRDVITLNKSEWDFARDLNIVKRRVANFYSTVDFWVGITGPEMVGAPAGHCVWVKLKDLTFSCYWFQVKRVRFTPHNEMMLQLKCVRKMTDDEALPRPQAPEVGQVDVCQAAVEPGIEAHWDSFTSQWRSFLTEDVATRLLTLCAVDNVKQALCFMSILLVTLLTFMLKALAHVGDYSIKFMREVSNFIHVATPIVLAIVDFITKCVGGLYLLIVMLWRGNQAPPASFPKHDYRPAIQDRPHYGKRW